MIIDASVGVKWFVPEENADMALALLARGPLFVPRLFVSEVTNALWKKARKGEIDLAQVEPVSSVGEVATFLDDMALSGRALELGVELDHPTYDCYYLAAAEALEIKLVTADRRFLAKVEKSAYASLVVELGDAEILP